MLNDHREPPGVGRILPVYRPGFLPGRADPRAGPRSGEDRPEEGDRLTAQPPLEG